MFPTTHRSSRFVRSAIALASSLAAMAPVNLALAQATGTPAPSVTPAKPTPPPSAPSRPKSDLPTAAEIQDRYIQATGGKEAYEKIKYRVYKAKIDVAKQKLQGTIEVVQGPGSKFHQVFNLTGIGKVEQGSDGNFVWENSPAAKYRLLRKSERAETLRNMNFRLELDLKASYPMMDSVGVEEVNGKDAYKMILVSKEGVASTRYYDKATGFLVKQTQTVAGPYGNVPSEMYFDDYRDINGMKFAHRTREIMPGTKDADAFEHVITVESIEFPESVDAALFDLPADIKKIIARYRGEDPNAAPEDAASAVTPTEMTPPPLPGDSGSKPDPTRPAQPGTKPTPGTKPPGSKP